MNQDLETPRGMARHGFPAMGTWVTLLLPVDAPAWAVGHAQATFEAWEATLSRFRLDSELSRLNAAAGHEVLVGDLLFDVTRAALAAAAATGGVFDPTLLHPLAAAGYDRSFELVPADRPGSALAARPGPAAGPAGRWADVRVDELLGSVTLPSGVGLDFGGIAKGMAVDATVAALAWAGIGPLVVEAGGDLAVHGAPAEGAWPVAVETGEASTTILLPHGALATSSTARRHWLVDGQPRHHLIDPRTGRPAVTDLLSATVAAPTCREAEVAAKCALILGRAAGTSFLEGRGFTGLVVTLDGGAHPVGGWELDQGAAA